MTQAGIVSRGYITKPPMTDYGMTNRVALCLLLWKLQAQRLRRLG